MRTFVKDDTQRGPKVIKRSDSDFAAEAWRSSQLYWVVGTSPPNAPDALRHATKLLKTATQKDKSSSLALPSSPHASVHS